MQSHKCTRELLINQAYEEGTVMSRRIQAPQLLFHPAEARGPDTPGCVLTGPSATTPPTESPYTPRESERH